MGRKKIVAGNWKMNLTVRESLTLAQSLHKFLSGKDVYPQVVVAPTYLSLYPVASALQNLQSFIQVAAQNVHHQENGAYTGEVSVSMLKDISLSYCIVGHSERRTLFGETDESIHLKVMKLFDKDIIPILCVGETLSEREAGDWQEVVYRQCRSALKPLSVGQVENIVIAYEPVWAIGTGVSASPEQAQEVHAFIRDSLKEWASHPEKVSLLYGGSVNAKNAGDIFNQEDIDGGLVGGASLKVEDFTTIICSIQS